MWSTVHTGTHTAETQATENPAEVPKRHWMTTYQEEVCWNQVNDFLLGCAVRVDEDNWELRVVCWFISHT
jgi:hypothetical protein